MYGSLRYTEAEMARYGGTLYPKFDTQEELYDYWLKELDEAINYLMYCRNRRAVVPQKNLLNYIGVDG